MIAFAIYFPPLRQGRCRFCDRGVEYDDLVQIGSLGMIKAVKSYCPEYGCVFSTYAVPLIIGEIRRYLRDDGMIKVSRGVKRLGIHAMKRFVYGIIDGLNGAEYAFAAIGIAAIATFVGFVRAGGCARGDGCASGDTVFEGYIYFDGGVSTRV